MSDQVKADELAAKYVKLRDFKEKISSEMKEKVAKVDAAMDKIENEMMTFLNQTGQESSATKFGTFFRETSTSARVSDRDVFLHFVMDNGAINFLTNHISADAVREYVAEHQSVPPGVDVVRKVKISVRRPSAR